MYFSEIRVDPTDPEHVYLLGIRLWRSRDGGRTFQPDAASRDVHPDHHALWIDPKDPRHLRLGTDGGIYVSRDGGANWDHLNHVAIGQYYHVAVDGRADFRVYGGLQDNGTWGGPSVARDGGGPRNEDFFRVGGGDGFRCQVDPEDPDLVYFEMQRGGLGRLDLRTGARGRLTPGAPEGRRWRFNWDTPFLLSHHNSGIYYVAAEVVFRSLSRGEALKPISPEISRTPEGSASALAESPLDPDRLWVGSDDGALWRTADGGRTWIDVFAPAPPAEAAEPARAAAAAAPEAAGEGTPSEEEPQDPKPAETPSEPTTAVVAGRPLEDLVPARRWVAWIEPSRHVANRVYLVLDGHRSDDDAPYLFASEDEGVTWRDLRGDLPDDAGTTYVLREDVVNPDLLYLGTEFGAWASVDRGLHWTSLNSNLPTVAVRAFALHATEPVVVAATHGRSLWVLDVRTLRQLRADLREEDAVLFEPGAAVLWRRLPTRGSARTFRGENPPDGARIDYLLRDEVPAVTLEVRTLDDKPVAVLKASKTAGLHRAAWDLRRDPEDGARGRRGPRVEPGRYLVVLAVGGRSHTAPLDVRIDPGHPDEEWLAHADEESEEEDARRRRGEAETD